MTDDSFPWPLRPQRPWVWRPTARVLAPFLADKHTEQTDHNKVSLWSTFSFNVQQRKIHQNSCFCPLKWWTQVNKAFMSSEKPKTSRHICSFCIMKFHLKICKIRHYSIWNVGEKSPRDVFIAAKPFSLLAQVSLTCTVWIDREGPRSALCSLASGSQCLDASYLNWELSVALGAAPAGWGGRGLMEIHLTWRAGKWHHQWCTRKLVHSTRKSFFDSSSDD